MLFCSRFLLLDKILLRNSVSKLSPHWSRPHYVHYQIYTAVGYIIIKIKYSSQNFNKIFNHNIMRRQQSSLLFYKQIIKHYFLFSMF